MQNIFEKISNPVIFVLIAALLRVIPHMPNFAPIGAMALFGGAYLGRRYALILPLAAMVLSDIFLGFDGIASRITVYSSFLLIGLIGLWLKNHRSFRNIVLATISSSVLFFVITNFGYPLDNCCRCNNPVHNCSIITSLNFGGGTGL